MIGNETLFRGEATHCILYRIGDVYRVYFHPENCVCINTSSGCTDLVMSAKKPVNNIFIGTAQAPHSAECDYNNYTTGSIVTGKQIGRAHV